MAGGSTNTVTRTELDPAMRPYVQYGLGEAQRLYQAGAVCHAGKGHARKPACTSGPTTACNNARWDSRRNARFCCIPNACKHHRRRLSRAEPLLHGGTSTWLPGSEYVLPRRNQPDEIKSVCCRTIRDERGFNVPRAKGAGCSC